MVGLCGQWDLSRLVASFSFPVLWGIVVVLLIMMVKASLDGHEHPYFTLRLRTPLESPPPTHAGSLSTGNNSTHAPFLSPPSSPFPHP